MNQLKAGLDEHVKLVEPKSQLGKAIHYALGQWSYVIRYVENGLLSIDNNIAEHSIKNLVISRKNWLFSTICGWRICNGGVDHYGPIRTNT